MLHHALEHSFSRLVHETTQSERRLTAFMGDCQPDSPCLYEEMGLRTNNYDSLTNGPIRFDVRGANDSAIESNISVKKPPSCFSFRKASVVYELKGPQVPTMAGDVSTNFLIK